MADSSPNPHISVTSNEPVGEKHLVLPYGEQPTVGGGVGHRTCLFCGNPGFRRSRPRLVDLARACLLQWPVRCTRCGQRQHVWIFRALIARRPRPHGGDAAVDAHSWGAWTGQANPPRQSSAPVDTTALPAAPEPPAQP